MNLTHCAVLSTLCKNHFLQNPTDRSASGTAIALHTQFLPHIVIHSHCVLVKGYLQTYHITIYKEECQLIYIYMPVNTQHATTVAQTLETHMKTLPLDRKVLIEGDWNVTLAVQDRENNSIILKNEQFLLNKSPP
jgi:exonuclease III